MCFQLAEALQGSTQAIAELNLHQKLREDAQLRVDELEESLLEKDQELQRLQVLVTRLQGEVFPHFALYIPINPSQIYGKGTTKDVFGHILCAGFRQADRQGADVGGGDSAEREAAAAVQAGGEDSGRPANGAVHHQPGPRRPG